MRNAHPGEVDEGQKDDSMDEMTDMVGHHMDDSDRVSHKKCLYGLKKYINKVTTMPTVIYSFFLTVVRNLFMVVGIELGYLW